VRRDRADLASHCQALRVVEIVEGAGVQDQSEALSDACRPQRRHVAVDEPHVDPSASYPVAGSVERLLDEVNARDLPAPLRELDPPDRAARAEIERRAVGRQAPGLLASEHVRGLPDERGIGGRVLPGVEADRVTELPIHGVVLAQLSWAPFD
jgi:hypothetical protein